jgi:hypothetical protein
MIFLATWLAEAATERTLNKSALEPVGPLAALSGDGI